MSLPRPDINDVRFYRGPTLTDLLTARPSGLNEIECWAILCQAVQALQDLFLSDDASSCSNIPLVTPATLILSSKGRVKLCRSNKIFGGSPPPHLVGYLAPEYRPNKQCSDTEAEKMWIYALGETLKRATLTSHAATSKLSRELCQILTDMTKFSAAVRASLMYLLDVISEYCKKRQQNRPFSHIVMDLHQEAMASIEMTLDTPWGPPAMPELKSRMRNRCESNIGDGIGTIPRRWINLTRNNDVSTKMTKEASTSMEDLSLVMQITNAPGSVVRPKSMCVPDIRYFNINDVPSTSAPSARFCDFNYLSKDVVPTKLCRPCNLDGGSNSSNGRLRIRRNPVNRAASRLYRAGADAPIIGVRSTRDCIGPEFVVRASLLNKQLTMPDPKGSIRRTVTVIMLNGQKLDILCNPNSTTAGQLFEMIIQKEHIEENFMLGLSALMSGDFVFLPSDTRICKAIQGNGSSNCQSNTTLTLFMRVRFFLPSLRGIRGMQARHLLYLQLRRSILEHQLPCSFNQLIELDGLALQAEFGDYNEREHGTRDYFLMEHYVPETMSCVVDDTRSLRIELIQSHMAKKGLDIDKAEQDFIILAQSLPHYGGHFYTATWIFKDNNHKDVWLYISAQGINLYERGKSSNCGPQLYEMFEWRSIQTLCYSKHYLCILPHTITVHGSKLKKYKLKMDHRKSYFTFRLASLHHQFFLRLRTEYTSLQSLSQQFGIPLKDMKNETNSLCKLEALTKPVYLDQATVNAETEFKIDFRTSNKIDKQQNNDGNDEDIDKIENDKDNINVKCKRSKSVHNFNTLDINNINEIYENKENENPSRKNHSGLVLNSSYLSGLPSLTAITDKRRGVKMGTKVFSNVGHRVSRSMETVNASNNEYLEEMSLQSVSLHCSSTSISRSPTTDFPPSNEAYILDSTIKSCSNNQLLPNFQETLSDTLIEKFNNISFADERILSTVSIERDSKGSLGIQITEGSDGNVYIQSVIIGGPADSTGQIMKGDQVIAVDGRSLLGMNYDDALQLLKMTKQTVEFVLSRNVRGNIHLQSTLRIDELKNKDNNNLSCNNINKANVKNERLENTMNKLKRLSYISNYCKSPVEKYLTESCFDLSNLHKYGGNGNISNTSSPPSEVPYHKHIRYEIESEKDDFMSQKKLWNSKGNNTSILLNKNWSKSCNQIYTNDKNNKAIIVDMIRKNHTTNTLAKNNFQSIDRKFLVKIKPKITIPPIALPRSLGLSRKWRGPVRYPVTPIKKLIETNDYLSTSDEEQVFI